VAISLVTGTSSGIGLATAVTLARGGHKVIATMRNLDGAGELRKIVSAEGLPITLATLDVDDDASVNDAVGKVLAENGCIDVLVNNAGVGSGGGSVEEVPIGAFRQVMETNFFGGLRCIEESSQSPQMWIGTVFRDRSPFAEYRCGDNTRLYDDYADVERFHFLR
jgi:NAD(P)-dependent dehydrogenase (short-subunit alcohol dehydrogenase family)